MPFTPSRRQLLLGTGALAMGSLVGCSTTTNVPSATPSADEPSLVAPSGSAAPELQPSPTAEDLVGGPDWKPADLSGKTLTLWGLNYAPHVERYKLLADRFKAATGAEVKLQPQDDVLKQTLAALAGNNAPDVICLMGRMSDQIVRQNGLQDLAGLMSDLKIDSAKWWMPEALGAYTWGDKVYGVPLEGDAHAGVSVRLDLAEKAGSKIDKLYPGSLPESDWPDKGVHFNSYDDLFAMAKEMMVVKDGKVKTWGLNRQGWDGLQLATLLRQQDVLWWDEPSGVFSFDNAACVNALEIMVTKPYELGIESNLAAGNLINAFVAGQTALALGNNSAAGEGTKAGFEATNVVQPSIIDGETPKFIGEGGWGFEIPTRAKNPDVALEFIRFATTYDAQFTWSQIYGGMAPACRPLVNSAIFQGDSPLKQGQRRLLLAAPNAVYQGHGYDPQIDALISTIIGTLREGKSSAKQTSLDLQKQVTAQQQRYSQK